MNLRPFTVATYGVYAAIAVAGLSVWLGKQAGASLDFALLRAVFIFVIFTALAFGAEAVLTIAWQPDSTHEPSSAANPTPDE